MRRYPLNRVAYQMVLSLVAGIFVASHPALGGMWVLVIFLFALLLWISQQWPALLGRALLLGVAFLAGWLLFWQSSLGPSAVLSYATEDVPREITGRVELAPENKNWLHLWVTHIDGEALRKPGLIRIMKPYGDETPYERATTVRFSGELLLPETPRNPGGFDEKRFLFSKGIYTKMKADSSGVTLASPAPHQDIINLGQERIDAILSAHTSEEHHRLIQAVLFGETGGLHDDFYSLSQRVGIIHIFSVSGLHVGFIVGFVLGIAALFRRQNSWAVFFLLLPLLAVYLILSGLSPPAMRAGIMAILGILALRLLRYKDLLTIIALAAAVLLSADPHLLWDIGFQLSFLITAGIVYGYEMVEGALPDRLPSPLRAALGLSLTAELVSAPLVAWYFYILAPFSIVMNVLVVPFFSILVPLALMAIFLTGILPVLAPVAFMPVQVILYVVVAMLRFFEAVFGSGHIYIGQPPLWLLFLYGFSLLLFFSGRGLSGKPRQLRTLLLLCLIGSLALFYTPLSRHQLLTVLDVGQGSSAVVQTPERKWLVFDTGAPKDTTAQFMRFAAVNRVEAVVLSHGDADHINGLRHLLRDFRVQHLFVTPDIQASEAWQEILPLIQRRNVQVHPVTDHLKVQVDPYTTVYLETREDAEIQTNRVQLLASLETESHRFIFPGDASSSMLKTYSPFSHADVVLAPHHGSKNSWEDTFYDSLQPDVVVVSCGQNNRYGHPHGIVEAGLTARHIPLLRTDHRGAIIFYAAAEGLHYDTFC